MGVFYKAHNKYFLKYLFMSLLWVLYGCYNHLNLVVCFSNNGHFGLQQ